jgi:hypothetical protein
VRPEAGHLDQVVARVGGSAKHQADTRRYLTVWTAELGPRSTRGWSPSPPSKLSWTSRRPWWPSPRLATTITPPSATSSSWPCSTALAGWSRRKTGPEPGAGPFPGMEAIAPAQRTVSPCVEPKSRTCEFDALSGYRSVRPTRQACVHCASTLSPVRWSEIWKRRKAYTALSAVGSVVLMTTRAPRLVSSTV